MNEKESRIFIKKIDNMPMEQLFVRCTTDDWESYTDVEANEIESSNDSLRQFKVEFPFKPFDNIEFAVGAKFKGEFFWDNNLGMNYKLSGQSMF